MDTNFLDFLDAHATWHLATVPFQLWWMRLFDQLDATVVEYIGYERERERLEIEALVEKERKKE